MTQLNLRGCEMGPRGLRALLSPIVALRKLQGLNLSGNELWPSGAEHVAAAAMELTALRELGLSRNEFGARGAARTSAVLRNATGLRGLDMSSNAGRSCEAGWVVEAGTRRQRLWGLSSVTFLLDILIPQFLEFAARGDPIS